MKDKPTTLRPGSIAYGAVNIIDGFISTDSLSVDKRQSRQIIAARYAGHWQEAYKDGWRIHRKFRRRKSRGRRAFARRVLGIG